MATNKPVSVTYYRHGLDLPPGGRKPTKHTVVGERITIGSSDESDITLTGDGVEWTHAVVSALEDAVVIQDRGSEAGTYLDGMLIDGGRICSGSVVRIGVVELAFDDAHVVVDADATLEERAELKGMVDDLIEETGRNFLGRLLDESEEPPKPLGNQPAILQATTVALATLTQNAVDALSREDKGSTKRSTEVAVRLLLAELMGFAAFMGVTHLNLDDEGLCGALLRGRKRVAGQIAQAAMAQRAAARQEKSLIIKPS